MRQLQRTRGADRRGSAVSETSTQQQYLLYQFASRGPLCFCSLSFTHDSMRKDASIVFLVSNWFSSPASLGDQGAGTPCLSVCMVRAVAASSTLCELCMLISFILAARVGLDNCARSKWTGGVVQVTTPPSRAVIRLSADPANAPNQYAPMQGKGSSAASAVNQPGGHECIGTYASPSRATSAAFGHKRRCRPGSLTFSGSHGDGDHHGSGFVGRDCSWVSLVVVVVPEWSSEPLSNTSGYHLGTTTATTAHDAHTDVTIRHATVSITAAADAETAADDAVEGGGQGELVTQERR